MGSLKHFERPDRLLRFAHDAIEKFVREARAVRYENILTRVREFEPSTGYTVDKIKVVGPLPDELERLATEAMNNIKNSFDQSLFAACAAIDRPVKDAHYPWTDGEAGLAAKRNSKNGKRIPEEVWEEIERQGPYKRPDSDIKSLVARDMAALANDKHTVGLSTNCSFARTITFVKSVHVPPGGGLMLGPPSWDPVKKEAVLSKVKGPVFQDVNYSITAHVVFDTKPPLGMLDAAEALGAFIEKAKSVHEGFIAMAKRLGAV